ncbi:OpgC domain-containing protein [Serinibacter arcticus]|uniref:OpgC domain-containing protein n=1 Tax=Serinibacter arcticus TaxID=1655435 RepID=UPI0022B8B7EA|nr:OpgC domain-containing protein [Serinibacter arcticus]
MKRAAPAAAQGRDSSLDLLRGFCIVSMATAHVAVGSFFWRATHVALWVDGLMGFVVLSGLVLGIVQRKQAARSGVRSGPGRVLRRARLVYVAHVALCAAVFAVVALDPSRAPRFASVDSVGGPLQAVLATVTLQINPPNASILSMYAVLMLLAAVAVGLLARGQVWLLVAGMVCVYVIGQTSSAWTTFVRQPGEPGLMNWATWQAMFLAALILGWYWDSEKVRAAFASRSARWTAASLLVFSVGLAHLTRLGRLGDGVIRRTIDWWFSDGTLGPGVIVLSGVALLVLRPVARWIAHTVPILAAVLERIGRRSLDCYIILSLAVIALPSIVVYDPGSASANVVVLTALAAMWAWCRLRDEYPRVTLGAIEVREWRVARGTTAPSLPVHGDGA